MDKKFFRWIFWLYSIVLFILSVVPLSPTIGGSDKIKHFLAFFIFVILLRLSWKIKFWQSIAIALFFGGLIEVVQAFIPYRSCDILDFTADAIGAFLGSISLIAFKIFKS